MLLGCWEKLKQNQLLEKCKFSGDYYKDLSVYYLKASPALIWPSSGAAQDYTIMTEMWWNLAILSLMLISDHQQPVRAVVIKDSLHGISDSAINSAPVLIINLKMMLQTSGDTTLQAYR